MLGTDGGGRAFQDATSLSLERDLYDDMVVADFQDTYNLDEKYLHIITLWEAAQNFTVFLADQKSF